jgi:glycosyltransferase involved in cell wall biosynthesis
LNHQDLGLTNHLKNNHNSLVSRLKLSVVIITKNEQQNIARCMASVLDFVDEVIVYDSGSADQTIEIAKKMGANVVSGEWLGFGRTKAKATLLAKHDWILSIDADEQVSSALKSELIQKFANLNPKVTYSVPRASFFLNQWISYGGWYPDFQIRLFNRAFFNWNDAEIHEKIESNHIESLKSNLNHYVFKNLSHQVQTNDRYSGLLAQKIYSEGKKFNYFHFLTKPGVKFFECYVFKLGFLDGYVGFVIAKNAAYSVFLKWAKLKEIQSGQGQI